MKWRKSLDVDLEVIDAGAAYTLYTSALVNLAIGLNEALELTSLLEVVSKYGRQLKDALLRCGVSKDIPIEIAQTGDILQFLQSGQLMLEISNLLVSQHARRQEMLFMLTCLIGGVFSGASLADLEVITPARTQALVIGQRMGVPDDVIEQCFRTKRLTPLRDFIRSTHPSQKRDWSSVFELKPRIPGTGLSFDLKRIAQLISNWWHKR